MLRAPSSHGKSVLLGTEIFLSLVDFHQNRPLRASRRLASPRRREAPAATSRVSCISGRWPVGATTEKLYVLNSSAGAARDQSRAGSISRVAPRTCTRPLWIRTARGRGGGAGGSSCVRGAASSAPLGCVLDFEMNRKSLLEWTRGHEIQPLRSSGTPGGRLGGSHITLLHYFFRDARLP